MKKFNQVIKIEVQVDAIANQLLNMFKEDVTYRESVVENIIGVHINENRVAHLYNAINGVLPELMEVDSIAYACCYVRTMIAPKEEGQEAQVLDPEYKVIVVRIIAVDPYSTRPYTIEYQNFDRSGKEEKQTNTVAAYDLATSPELIKK